MQRVKQWPQPHNITEFQQFLGLGNYNRRYIHQYATIKAPLTNILQQKGSFTFGIEQKRAFQKLKDALTWAPALTTFDPALPRRVLADTLGFSSGAILKQLFDGNWHPVEYISKWLSDIESSWSATEREILGYYFSIRVLVTIFNWLAL